MRLTYCIVGTSLLAAPAFARDLTVSVEIPRLRVAEYHKPYVAVWLEDAAGKVTNLELWYDADMRGNEGVKWLPDLRTWWRRSGRALTLPVDGVSGPTQGPGTHRATFREGTRPLPRLAPGQYKLTVEAAREVGGRETVSIPFQWPPRGPQTGTAKGASELGAVSLSIKP